MRIKSFARTLLALFLLSSISQAQDITVAAAADLRFVFQDVAARFQKETGHKAKMIFGSSGNFFSQVKNGAPFDIFFSADISYPQRLEAAALTEPGSLYEYATGKIVLLVPKGSPLDLKRGLPALLDPSVKKIAIANPEHAPYGRAAVAALRYEKIYDQLSPKFVLGENISQTASFVVSGGADAGIVALSLALAPSMQDKASYVSIPDREYPPIRQAAVVLKTSQQKEIARQFIAFLRKPEISSLFEKYGFAVPKGK